MNGTVNIDTIRALDHVQRNIALDDRDKQALLAFADAPRAPSPLRTKNATAATHEPFTAHDIEALQRTLDDVFLSPADISDADVHEKSVAAIQALHRAPAWAIGSYLLAVARAIRVAHIERMKALDALQSRLDALDTAVKAPRGPA